MSSFIVSKTDSNSKPSSPILHRIDENTVRQAMHKLFLHDNINDPLSPGDDDDLHSPSSSSNSFKTNHAKFSSNFISYILSIYFYIFNRRIIIGMDHT